MAFAKWLTNRLKGINLSLLVVTYNINLEELTNVMTGIKKPTYQFLIKIMYCLNLNNKERLELFFLAGESMGISAHSVYNGILNELAYTNNEKISLNR